MRQTRTVAPVLSRIAKIAAVLGAGVVVLYLLGMLGMNVFLQTRLFRHSISFSPDEFRLEYSRAYSTIPGKIYVEGLTIRGSDSAVEWILALDRCTFRVSFLDLLHRRFHAEHVRGDGLSLRVRLKLEGLDAPRDLVNALPPIPGFADPPYRLIGPPRPPLTDADYRLWSVQLDDVDAEHVRELWIHSVRYAGDMRVRGRWLFRPVRWLEVGPARVDVRLLDVTYGGQTPLFTGLRGTVDATVHPFDVREPDGLEILKYVSTRAELAGVVDSARLFEEIAPAGPFTFVRGSGPVSFRVVVDRGVLRPDTAVSVSSGDTHLLAGAVALDASIAAELRVENDSDPPVARVDVDVSGLRMVRHGVELARAAALSIRTTDRDVDLTRPSVQRASFGVELRGLVAPTIAPLRPWLPAGLDATSGALRGDGHLEGFVEGETARGTLRIAVDDVAASVGRVPLRADHVGARIDVREWSWGAGTVDVSDSGLDLRGVSVRAHGNKALLVAARAVSVHAHRLVFAPGGARGTVTVDVPETELGELGPLARMVKLPAGVFVDRGQAWAAAHLDADVHSLSASGTIALRARNMRVRVGSDTYQGDLTAAIRAHPSDIDPRTTDLSGTTLAFTSSGDPSTDAWWARVGLADAKLRLAGEPRFRAVVHATAQDNAPAQAWLASATGIPRWLIGAFPMDDLRVDGEVSGTPSSFEARSVVARGSRATVRLEYAARGADKRGMALVSSGTLRMGFTLAGEGQKFLLFGAESWFCGQREKMRSALAERIDDPSDGPRLGATLAQPSACP